MRRTLTVVALAATMLVPAAAASADPGSSVGSNASCSNGKGGNDKGTYNGKGNTVKAASCVDEVTDGQPITGPTEPPLVELPESENS